MTGIRLGIAALCVLVGPLTLSSPSFGVDAPPIIVTATRTPLLADESLASVIVITREQIERSVARDIPTLLRMHAGLDMAQTGGRGQSASLFLRGTESNHTLVMVDGIKINPGTLGIPALQNIDPALVERIEIVKGPRSALYGSDAIGGVIHIFTRGDAASALTQARITGGRYDSGSRSLLLRRQGAKLRFGLGASHDQSAGFPTLSNVAIDRGYENDSVNLFAGATLGAMDVDLSHWRARGMAEYVDFTLNPADQDFSNQVTALKLRSAPSAAWTTTLTLGEMRDNLDQNQNADFAHTRRNTLDWQNDVVVGDRQLITAGVWLSRETTRTGGVTAFDVDTDADALYIQDDIALGRRRLVLSARHTDHETAGTKATWGADYGYDWTERTNVRFSAGTGFRAPDSTDRFGFGGNPGLRPEISRSLEAGLRHRRGENQRLELSVFDTRIEDLIEYDFVSATVQNKGRARIRGIEGVYTIAVGPWEGRLEAIAQDPENSATGEALLRRSPRSATLALHYRAARYGAGIELQASARRPDVDATTFLASETAGYALTHLSGHWRIARALQFSARVENLFDRDYELVDGYAVAGRSLWLELQLSTPSVGS